MSLKPLTLSTLAGTHTFDSYSLPTQGGRYALSRFVRAGGSGWPGARGDRQREPQVLNVTAYLEADTLVDVTHAALDLISDLEGVYHVGTHQGDYAASGLLAYSFGAPVGTMLPLHLSFAVTDRYGFRPPLDSTDGWTSDSVISTLGIPNTNPAFTVPGTPVLRTQAPNPPLQNNRTWRVVNSLPDYDNESMEALIVLRTSRDLPRISNALRLGLYVGNSVETTTLTLSHIPPYAGQFNLSLVDNDGGVVLDSTATTIQPATDVWVAFRINAQWLGAGVTRFRGKAWTAASHPGGEPGDWQVDAQRFASDITRVGVISSGLHFSGGGSDAYLDIGLYAVTFGGMPAPQVQL